MKKLLILTLILLFALSGVVCAKPSDAEVIASFKKYVSEELSKAISTYKIDNYEIRESSGMWYKFTENLDPNYTVDVKKNNSLTSPYIGMAEISRVFNRGEDCSTKELAEASSALSLYDIFKYRFIAVYRDNKWVVVGVEYYNYFEETTSIYDRLKKN